jgi:hypothetical protein
VAHGQSKEQGAGGARQARKRSEEQAVQVGHTKAQERGASEWRRVRVRWEKAERSERAVSE